MVGGRYRPLSDAEVLRVHELALRLLEDLGLSQITPSLEARAVAAGCRVDGDGRLRFPRALVEDVIARSRRSFTLQGIDPIHDIEIGGKRVHTGTGGATPTIMDFETGKYRETTVPIFTTSPAWWTGWTISIGITARLWRGMPRPFSIWT